VGFDRPRPEAHWLVCIEGRTGFHSQSNSLPCPFVLPYKLSFSDCQLVIASFNHNLSRWQASLLSRVGHLVIASIVLSALTLHYILAIGLHKIVIKAIDSHPRAFLECRRLLPWIHINDRHLDPRYASDHPTLPLLVGSPLGWA
jgi:hypothetical protein